MPFYAWYKNWNIYFSQKIVCDNYINVFDYSLLKIMALIIS